MIRFNLKSNRFLSSLVLGLSLTCVTTAWADQGVDYSCGFESGTDAWGASSMSGGILSETTVVRTGGKSVKCGCSNANGYARRSVIIHRQQSTNYIHFIIWAKSSAATTAQIKSAGGTAVSVSVGTSDWTQMVASNSVTGSGTTSKNMDVLPKMTSGSFYLDDAIVYYSTNATADITAPTAATGASATTSSISWTNGSDANTGIQNTTIWRRTSGSADDLNLNAQGIYAASATDQSGHWTCVSATVGADATSYAGTFSGGDRYAIVHRDLAYNYSTPTYVTVAGAACEAPTSVGITGTTSYTEGQTISLTAAATGGTGTASYQWYKGGTASGNKITGATNATYTKASCTTADAGNYYCIISTGSTCSTTSSACAVSVATVPTCTAPTSVDVSGTWHIFPGEPITLTATATGGSGTETPSYQWYKNGTDESNAIAGATGAIYTKDNCAYEDAGLYYCKVSTGEGCTTTSGVFKVKMLRMYFNVGRNGTDYGYIDLLNTDPDNNKAAGMIFLGENYDYAFSVADGCGDYYGCNNDKVYSAMHSGNCTDWEMNSDQQCWIRTANGATYTFIVEYTNMALPRVTAIYPPSDQAADKMIYFDNSVLEWSNLHYRIGKSDYTEKHELSLVHGTANLYVYQTTEWNGLNAWHIANNAGWSGGHSIYKTNTGDEYAITKSIKFEGGATTQDITITPSDNHSTGSESYNNNCEFYSNVMTPGMKTQNVAIVTPEHGTITVSYIDVNNDPQSFTSGDRDLAHTVIITPTANPATGYEFGSLTVNGNPHTSNTTYIVYDATTIEATFTPKNYTIHLNGNGGSGNTPSVDVTYDSNVLPSITNPSLTGYTFEGWYSGEGGTGSLIINTSGTLQANVPGFTGADGVWNKASETTLYAKWTVSSHILTWDFAGGSSSETAGVDYTAGGSVNYGATILYPSNASMSKAGCEFAGWSPSPGTMPDNNLTITAQWDMDCPHACSGETVYKFEVNSSVSDGNVCSSGNNPKTLTTPTQLSTLTGGTLEGYITNNSSWNNLTFSSGRITYANNDRGVLIITLDCPIREGDLIRFNNYSGSNSKYNYLRHTSNSTTDDQLTLNASKTATEIQQIVAPAEFDGKTELFIVPGSRTTGISYFEIIRPVIITLDAATNGGTVGGNGTKEISAANGDVIGLTRAAKDGYSFKGWFTAPSGGSPVSNAYTVAGCTTLYAQFDDCPESGSMYKFEVGTELTNGAVTANSVAFDFNTANYLSTLIGGTLITDGTAAAKVLIANTNAISIQDNAAYLRIDMDCALKEGDVFRATVGTATMYVTKTNSRTSTAILPVGELKDTPIPEALIGAKTLYLWKGGGNATISYFEITRPRQTVITLSATGAYNHYTSSVVATLGAAMPELEILPQRASYVFNGYYDAPNGAGTMYYNGLGFGVQDWDKDVSTATLYAYWLEPCEVAPTLESTAPMTTIWDNQKVDIALAKLTCDYDTTGIHYSLLSASDAIAGCTFAYFDERIYIQGTPSLGNDMIVTKTITFTMTNDCSPASTYTVDATIRIYPADRKARLAYIITGTENGGFTEYTESDETNSSALLLYLRQFYTVNCVNGYATKDSAEIANYYKDYDLLIVTDFMSTPLGYTNAIGTLIDKKPILSFEAYVAGSNGTNWHIGSNPADPSPKVKMMKVLCAGHTIFGDAEGVEVINKPGGVSDTTITVLSATSGKGLQGFEINKAPDDFIFLATVRDENNHRNLIVSCERQAVFQARLLMYCINFNEMANLTAAGKVVMHQMIDYLLMTDETKVADCSLVFDNHDGDHLWSNPANWAPGYNIVPTPFHGTRIIAECHVVNPDAHAGSIKVNKGRDEYGNVVDGKVIIEPTGGLTIAGVVQSVNDTRYASPSAIKAEDLLIKSDENNSGSLVYGNKESDVRATVRYYSRGDKALTSPEWQYMGIPFQASKTAIQMFRDAWMCRWSSATTDGLGGLWQWVDNYDVLIPFEGYCITQENKKTYEFNGKLNPPVTTIIDLDNRDEEGYAFAANSWTAPIKIQNMEDDDFENAEKAIYIYHTGSYQDYVDHGGATPISSKDGAAISQPGQYAVVPIHSSPYLTGADSVIPAMQGFFVKASAAGDASVRLVYNTTVYDAEYFCTSNQPMRAPRRDNAPDVMLINMTGQNYGDRVYILSRPDFSDEFEDGWDGRKVEGSPYAPMLSVAKQAGDMSIAALPTAEGRYLTFRAGVDTEYTVTFTYEGETIYLYDQLTREATRIQTGNTYSFTATNETPTQRFLITANPPQVPTGVSLVETEESLHFDNYGNAPVDVRIVDMQGRVVYTCNSTDQIVDIRPMLPYGVYLAHIKMGDDYKVVRMIGKEGAK